MKLNTYIKKPLYRITSIEAKSNRLIKVSVEFLVPRVTITFDVIF